MIYGDIEILDALEQGFIRGSDPAYVNPASVNVRLGDTFLIPKRKWGGWALGDKVEYKRRQVRKNGFFILWPGQFVLATTMEAITLPESVAAFVQGRSSIGRAGLTTQNAGFVDPGFDGHITLELKNETLNPLLLIPGYPVAQLVFMQCTKVAHPYTGKYNGQTEATGSRMDQDKDAKRLLRCVRV